MLKKWLNKIKVWFRLKRIERATHIHLRKYQRQVVLNPERPTDLANWERKSGKTITAIFWTLMWYDFPIYPNEEFAKLCLSHGALPMAIPDPDVIGYERMVYSLQDYKRYSEMCTKAKIKVSLIQKSKTYRAFY